MEIGREDLGTLNVALSAIESYAISMAKEIVRSKRSKKSDEEKLAEIKDFTELKKTLLLAKKILGLITEEEFDKLVWGRGSK